MQRTIFQVLVISLLGACQSQGGSNAGIEVADLSVDAARGEKVYAQHCATCHGETGAGNEPWFPSLQRLAALRQPTAMVETVITGRFRRGGELDGHTIPIMPAWGQLSDADVAAIVNYIAQNWGTGDTLTADQVRLIRNDLWNDE